MADITGCINKIRTSDSTEHYINAKYWDGHEWGELAGALKYCGITTTKLTDGATTNPVVIDGENHTATAGCVVFYEDTEGDKQTTKEFVFNGNKWELLGADSTYKVIQNSVSSPNANGSAVAFIDTISQDANGVITVSKKNVDFSNVVKPNDLKTINGESILGNGDITTFTSITWEDLVALRDNGMLVSGQQYRITDYITTTTQANTQSEDNQFDVIVTADDENTLNEVARACLHDGDEYFSDAGANLEAWQIWYCLDNDTERFAWADSTEGKGVIYRMIDEWNNDCPYDFKNIQFKRKLTAGVLDEENGVDTWVYTFHAYDMENDIYEDAWMAIGKAADDGCNSLYGNIIKPYCFDYDKGENSQCYRLNDIVFLNTYEDGEGYYFECSSNSFGNKCHNNTFGNDCHSNSFGNKCYNNTFKNYCHSNSFGNGCQYNSFGNYCSSNSFGNYCSSNSFGNSCAYYSFGNGCYSNSFGNNCSSNSFGNYCNNNSFGNSCYYNSFGNYCSSNKLLKSYTYYCHFDDGCRYINLTTSQTTSSNVKLQNVNVNRGVGGTSSSNMITININTLNSEKEINVDNVNGYIYILEGPENIYKTTYSNLVSIRDNSQLIPGMQYRITDYITTTASTAQEIIQSAGHQFDVIVTADNESTLNEIARACLHEGDTYFSGAGAKLDAWQIWYCLDNDTDRFTWAGATNGKGVIYRMIDEWNNDCPYDFKNIMFFRFELNAPETLDDNDLADKMAENIQAQFTAGSLPYIWGGMTYDEDRYWDSIFKKLLSTKTGASQSFYTFSNIINGVITDKSITNNYCYGNVIKEYISSNKIKLNNIIFFNTSNTSSCYSNSFGNNCYYNSFGNRCNSNSFGDNCHSNSFGYDCHSNSFGDEYQSNSFGDNCKYNSFGNYCYNNIFMNFDHRNLFGDNCHSNSFGTNCNSNSFGDYYYYNSFGDNCYYNSFKNNCYSNSFGNNCNSNSFGNNCYRNSFGNRCVTNSFGNYCYSNLFGDSCDSNSFGNSCSSNYFGTNADTLKSYYRYNSFGDGCQYIKVINSINSSSFYVQNYKFAQGLQGTSASPITITCDNSNDFNRSYETKVAKNKGNVVKTYCEADWADYMANLLS